jgi:hypothetical protein
MLKLIAVRVIAFLGWLLGWAIGYVIGFRGGRPLLERPGRTQKFRLKTIDKGAKRLAVLIGSPRAIGLTIRRVLDRQRYTALADRLKSQVSAPTRHL